MTQKQKKKIENTIGWCGAAATLVAYFLVSFSILDGRSLLYQILNLSGAIGLGTICYFKRTYQPFVVNVIWATIAVLAIFNIVFFLKQP